MRSFQWIVVAVAGALVFGPAAAQNTVYKWTDSQGKVHFSDTPPNEQAKGLTQKRMVQFGPALLSAAEELKVSGNSSALLKSANVGTWGNVAIKRRVARVGR